MKKLFIMSACLIFLIGCSATLFPIDSDNIRLEVRKQNCDPDFAEIEYKADIKVRGGSMNANNAICITKLDGVIYGKRESRKEQSGNKVIMFKTVNVPRDGADHTFELCCAGGISLTEIEDSKLGCKSQPITKENIEAICS